MARNPVSGNAPRPTSGVSWPNNSGMDEDYSAPTPRSVTHPDDAEVRTVPVGQHLGNIAEERIARRTRRADQ